MFTVVHVSCKLGPDNGDTNLRSICLVEFSLFSRICATPQLVTDVREGHSRTDPQSFYLV